jgi:hypothetical protein
MCSRDGAVTYGADPVAPADIRRVLEPLEFDCTLHYDRAAAMAAMTTTAWWRCRRGR